MNKNYMAGKRALVTGAGGFIGSHLVEALVTSDAEGTALVHYNADAAIGNLRLVPAELRSRVQVVHGDLNDGDFMRPLIDKVEVVFHLGALIAIPHSYAAPRSYIQTNVEGTLNVLEAVRDGGQRLCRIVRAAADRYEEDDLGAVAFVPLVGAQGWDEDGRYDGTAGPRVRMPDEAALVAAAAEPLPLPEVPAFAGPFDRFGNCRVVLLGESTHGTSEFYRARAAITRRLVERHGFNIVALEADWPDAAALNRHVRHRPPAAADAAAFSRFPRWMWRNAEVAALAAWLRAHNAGLDEADQVGVYGLDLYSLGASMAAVVDYLEGVDPDAADLARRRYGCLAPWRDDPSGYGLAGGYARCEEAVVRQCRELLERRLEYARDDGERYLDAAQNARLVASAERYYRAMYQGGAEAWNARDTHMFQTLHHLLEARGPGARAVVWAHNSHVGDARHTAMGLAHGQLSIGQLCREAFAADAALVGLGTHEGTVAAARAWGAEAETMQVRPSRPGSVERLCHDSGIGRFLLDLRPGRHDALRERLSAARLQRFIGVLYLPASELESHYAQASLARQFDAWVWFDRSEALVPLDSAQAASGPADTWPFGL